MEPDNIDQDTSLLCRICGDVASALHYGISTCSACKAFYKRSLGKPTDFGCSLGGSCTIDVRTRARCKACRLKKCLDQGMTAEAPENGVATPQTARSNSEADLPSGNGAFGVSVVAAGHAAGPSSHSSAAISARTEIEGIDRPQPQNSIRAMLSGIFQSFGQRNSGRPGSDNRVARRSRSPLQRSFCNNNIDFMLCDFSQDSIRPCLVPDIRRSFLSGVNRLEVDMEPSTLEKYWGVMRARNTVLEDSVRTVADAAQIVFGDTIRANEAAYDRLYVQRLVPFQPECSLSQMCAFIEASLYGLMPTFPRFAALVPGFSDLGDSDQASIMKERVLLSCLILQSPFYCEDDSYFAVGPYGFHYCRYWMRMTMGPEFTAFVFAITTEIKKLQLNWTELSLLLAVSFFRRGSTDVIDDKKYVDFLYAHYLDALIHLIGPNRGGILPKLRQILARFPLINEVRRIIQVGLIQNGLSVYDIWESDEIADLIQSDPERFALTDYQPPHF